MSDTVNESVLTQGITMPDLLIEGLNRYNDRPCLFMGEDQILTYADMRALVSRMMQALASLGLGKGTRTLWVLWMTMYTCWKMPKSMC